MKRALLLIMALLLLLLVACSQNNVTPTENEPSTSVSEPTSAAPSESPVVSGAEESTPGDTVESTEPAQSPAQSTSSAPAQTPNNGNNTQSTTSRPANPPATSSPPPATSTPPTTSTPSKPTYNEADFQRIIDTVKEYGESKGLSWNKDFTFEQGHQYYGRPNLERDGYDRVVETLKYHVDQIISQYGICDFKVVKHLYGGNTEFVVLYD